MRTTSLSSRLQWAFRGSVLPDALATGDVDNDGCNEFVVGSVQGELAIFRGRGGCGSWRYSEDQIEPEFDCWSAVEQGEYAFDPNLDDESLRRRIYASISPNGTSHAMTSLSSQKGSYTADDILHILSGGDKAESSKHSTESSSSRSSSSVSTSSSCSSDDEFNENPKPKTHLHQSRSEALALGGEHDNVKTEMGHIRWEDALSIERDGRKPWVIAQKLGTISAVVVADICNTGHNSIIVVNGEGKCHIFDYPFKRKVHPDPMQRWRQQRHLRRFSQERFFMKGTVVSNDDTNMQDNLNDPSTYNKDIGADKGVKNSEYRYESNTFNTANDLAADQDSYLHVGNNIKDLDTEIRKHHSQTVDCTQRESLSKKASTVLSRNNAGDITTSDLYATSNSTNPTLGANMAGSNTLHQKEYYPVGGKGASKIEDASAYTVGPSIHQDITTNKPSTQNTKNQMNPITDETSKSSVRENPASSVAQHHSGWRDVSGAKSPPIEINKKGYSGRRYAQSISDYRTRLNSIEKQSNPEAIIDTLSSAYGDGFDSDMDQRADSSQIFCDGSSNWLTHEEIHDIEKIWGTNVGKKSGDWFPFVLDSPDLTFEIPTNVEHAKVTDIDGDGMNELVLAATDGFVYIFRLVSSKKHNVKPTFTSLGSISNLPTTIPSINATGTGSPYLARSAPKSQDISGDESDIKPKGNRPRANTDTARNTSTDKSVGKEHIKSNLHRESIVESNNPSLNAVAQDTIEGPGQITASKLHTENTEYSLAKQLLKSIDTSATPEDDQAASSQPCTSLSSVTIQKERSDTSSINSKKARDTGIRPALLRQTAVLASEALNSDLQTQSSEKQPLKRRQSTGRRSLTTRMRESFGGIISGWETAYKNGLSHIQTAPPSINHSRIHTAENSAHTTHAHSRMPSNDDVLLDLDQVSAELIDTASNHSDSTVLNKSDNTQVDNSGQVRSRRASNAVRALDILEEVPERRSTEIDSKHVARNPNEVQGTIGDTEQSLSRQTATRDKAANESDQNSSISGDRSIDNKQNQKMMSKTNDDDSLDDAKSSERAKAPLKDDTSNESCQKMNQTLQNADYSTEFTNPFSLQYNGGGTGSRAHSRHSSISKYPGLMSRDHTRKKSSSVSSTKMRRSSVAHLGDDGTVNGLGMFLAVGEGRRTSIVSSASIRDGSTPGMNHTGAAAEPLEFTVNARGSFSKLGQTDDNNTPATSVLRHEDDGSIISQVTERLTKLSRMSIKGVNSIQSEPFDIFSNIPPNKRLALLHYLENDPSVSLPPTRSVIDWSSVKTDKIATWFLDNIPGDISTVQAEAGTFGQPLTDQRGGLSSGFSSECDCSSCECSLIYSDSESSEFSEESSCESESNIGIDYSNSQVKEAGISDTDSKRQNTNSGEHRGSLDADDSTRAPALEPVLTPVNHTGVNLPAPLMLNMMHADHKNKHLSTPSENSGLRQTRAADKIPTGTELAAGSDNKNEAEHGFEIAAQKVAQTTDKQPFLILSKPGGRFVPIDMKTGRMLPDVDPPRVPMSIMTGGNTSFLMNVSAGDSIRGNDSMCANMFPMSQYSGTDFYNIPSSYIGNMSSWNSGSILWVTNPLASASALKGNNTAKSFTASPSDGLLGSKPIKNPESHAEESSQKLPGEPNSEGQDEQRAQYTHRASLSDVNTTPQLPSDPGSIASQHISRKVPSIPLLHSFFNSSSSSTNIRNSRGIYRAGYDSSRGVLSGNFGHGNYQRSFISSGTMTPVANSGFLGSMHSDKRNLGIAGLRGYIGNNPARYRAGGGTEGPRWLESGVLTGHQTPLMSGNAFSRGPSASIGQGSGLSAAVRDSQATHPSSVSTNTSTANHLDCISSGQRSINMIHGQKGMHNTSLTLSDAVSPQRRVSLPRHSPSSMYWSSYKEPNVLSTIKDDYDDFDGGTEESRSKADAQNAPQILNSGLSNKVYMSSNAAQNTMFRSTKEPVSSPATDRLSNKGYWPLTRPSSVRSYSSMTTGHSQNPHTTIEEEEEEAEEEIEEAPQPMELDVATFMVGGVSTGRWNAKSHSESDKHDSSEDDDLSEIVSLVTMDGAMSCYDPRNKISHFISLNSRDPILGIWKIKMHDEIISSPFNDEKSSSNTSNLSDMHGMNRKTFLSQNRRICRKVGLSRNDLAKAVQFSTLVEDQMYLLDRYELNSRSTEKGNAFPMNAYNSNNFAFKGKRKFRGGSFQHMYSGELAARNYASALELHRIDEYQQSLGGSNTDPVSKSNGFSSHSDTSYLQKGTINRNVQLSQVAANSILDNPSGVSSEPHSRQRQQALNTTSKPLSNELAMALSGWYGENKNDYRHSLRVSDHLVISTWRGTTYFVDVATIMEIASYSRLYMEWWKESMAIAEEASECQSVTDKDGSVIGSKSGINATLYGHLSQFSDITDLTSRLRANASVIQFKFQDTVSAFLADTYAPATGGPNLPCLFFVDYKDRIWVYYHLDEIAEMDDIYGATWMKSEQRLLQSTTSKSRSENCDDVKSYNADRPFSIVDLAFRRVICEPWIPLPGCRWYDGFVSNEEHKYPYSAKTWKKLGRHQNPLKPQHNKDSRPLKEKDRQEYSTNAKVEDLRTFDPSLHTESDSSTQAFHSRKNANITGKFHYSFTPAPYMCPIWADLDSVDLYDLGAPNILEIAAPELLDAKDMFCKDLGVDPNSVDERVNLATIPGLAAWVRTHIYMS